VRLGHARDTSVLLLAWIDPGASAMAGRERDRELLLPVVAGEHAAGDEDDSEPTTPAVMAGPPPPAAAARALHLHHHPTGIEVI
jgi:hypothetical protein